MKRRFAQSLMIVLAFALAAPVVQAEQLFKEQRFANLASDVIASGIGDVLTVVVVQEAEARSSGSSAASRDTSLNGGWQTDATSGFGELNVGGGFNGRGEIRRSGSILATFSVEIVDVLANGDFVIEGAQSMRVNQEQTQVAIRGRVRPQDIARDNTIVSSRIAHAEIDYDGQGFVSRTTRPGVLTWLFNVLRLG